MLEKIKSYNVKILDGKTEIIKIRNQEINISGIDDPDAENYTDKGEVFYSQLEEIEKIKIMICLLSYWHIVLHILKVV